MFKSIRFLPVISLMIVATLVLAACGGAALATGKPVNVQVTLTDFKINSSLTTFTTGVPYHFVVTNLHRALSGHRAGDGGEPIADARPR